MVLNLFLNSCLPWASQFSLGLKWPHKTHPAALEECSIVTKNFDLSEERWHWKCPTSLLGNNENDNLCHLHPVTIECFSGSSKAGLKWQGRFSVSPHRGILWIKRKACQGAREWWQAGNSALIACMGLQWSVQLLASGFDFLYDQSHKDMMHFRNLPRKVVTSEGPNVL